MFWDFLLLISLTAWILRAGLASGARPEALSLALLAFVALIAFGRVAGGWYSRVVRTAFRVFLPIASLLAIAAVNGTRAAADFLVLVLMLFGLYIMLRGLRARH